LLRELRVGESGDVQSWSEAVDLVTSPFAAEDLAGSLLVVDGGVGTAPPGTDVAALAEALSTLPCVSVVVVAGTPWPPPDDTRGFDVVVSGALLGQVDAELDALADAIRVHPQATLVAAQVLRTTSTVPIAQALTVESLAYSTLQGGEEHRAWLAARSRPTRVDTEPGPAVTVDRTGDVLTVTLNRPHVRNAVNTAVRDGLVEALRTVAGTAETRAVIRGAGPAFCSGGDLDEFGTTHDPATAHVVRLARSPAWWTAAVGPRLRAEVHGACAGAGLELSAWAAEVVAADDACFFLPEVALGLIPGAGGTVSLPRRIGRQRTALLALTGARLDADQALAWGVADVRVNRLR
jgi:hypothetical protein